ncbi:MAG: tail fiber domain-containing protein [Proteobacteria bacterium]|nr:tail fiber domain-containing protein [Pseudomonadota bacterium]
MGQIRSPCLGLERLLAAFRLSSSYKLYVAGNAYTTGTWGGSDARWKKNIDPLENSLDKVAQLNGVNFEWDIDRFPKKGFEKGRQVGLIAREVEKVVPELVGTDEDGYKSVSYEKLSAVLIEAVKELKAENEALKILICQDHPEAVLFQ